MSGPSHQHRFQALTDSPSSSRNLELSRPTTSEPSPTPPSQSMSSTEHSQGAPSAPQQGPSQHPQQPAAHHQQHTQSRSSLQVIPEASSSTSSTHQNNANGRFVVPEQTPNPHVQPPQPPQPILLPLRDSSHPVPGPSIQGSLMSSRPPSEGDALGDRSQLLARASNSRGISHSAPLPAIPTEYAVAGMDGRMPLSRRGTIVDHLSMAGHGSNTRSGIDWIIPTSEKGPRNVSERIQPTLDHAIAEREKSARKAKLTGWALNIAIGLQVLFGALTTGLSAVTEGRQTSIMTAILGGLSTLVASFLARARGSNEPELSITRVKDLDQFIRELQTFQMDHGTHTGNEFDERLHDMRAGFEELMGNGNGERRLSPPA